MSPATQNDQSTAVEMSCYPIRNTFSFEALSLIQITSLSDGIKIAVTGLDDSGNLVSSEDESVAVACEARSKFITPDYVPIYRFRCHIDYLRTKKIYSNLLLSTVIPVLLHF